MNTFIKHLPKAELHVHLVGTLEPTLLMRIAERNNIKLYADLTQAQQAYADFNSLNSFVNAYDIAVSVLKTEQDFYDLTMAYLQKVSEQGVLRSEFFFEVQNFEQLGVSFKTIITGITTAMSEAKKKYGINSAPILCFIRNFDEASALHALKQSLLYKDIIIGCGLAGIEQGYPPASYTNLFNKVREVGYKVCVHAGEDAGSEYIWQAIRDLRTDRIAHGVRCMDDQTLVEYLKQTQLPLTVCPLSNTRLNIFTPQEHPLKTMINAGLNVSIHSDDPAFFEGYIAENYAYAHTKMGLSREHLIQCARNSLVSSFACEEEKEEMLKKFEKYVDEPKEIA